MGKTPAILLVITLMMPLCLTFISSVDQSIDLYELAEDFGEEESNPIEEDADGISDYIFHIHKNTSKILSNLSLNKSDAFFQSVFVDIPTPPPKVS